MTAIPEFETHSIPAGGRRNLLQKLILPLGIFLLLIFCLAPILWQVLTSIKVSEDISTVPNIYFPSRYTLKHYIDLFTRRPFARYILNSAFVSIVSTVLCLGIGTPAAYALARLRLQGEKFSSLVLLLLPYFPLFCFF
jgi:multiple sugar transport system permease protein